MAMTCVLHFRHTTGTRCVVRMHQTSAINVRVDFSFRRAKPFAVQDAKQWAIDWNAWADAIVKGDYDRPDPPGWRLQA